MGKGNIKASLLSWYYKNKRDLPWRKTKDPYKIWISEIMLQQTQVKTVIDYYRRFLTRFPTVTDLANAKEEEVFALWSGLGYYSRARSLHRAAKKIVGDHDAKFPEDPDEILSLPGIGKYTLGAIASIALDQPLPLVDGNVMRVYSRVFAVKGNLQNSSFQKKIWGIAEKLIPKKNPGDFNQALMELGATLCAPLNPLCLICPIQKQCEGRKQNPEKFPEKKKKIALKKLYRPTAILIHENRVLLTKPSNSRWQKGLWQLPGVFLENDKNFESEIKKRLSKMGLSFRSLIPLPAHTHHITHHKITIYPYRILSPRKMRKEEIEESEWAPLENLSRIAIPAPDRKILESLKISG